MAKTYNQLLVFGNNCFDLCCKYQPYLPNSFFHHLSLIFSYLTIYLVFFLDSPFCFYHSLISLSCFFLYFASVFFFYLVSLFSVSCFYFFIFPFFSFLFEILFFLTFFILFLPLFSSAFL